MTWSSALGLREILWALKQLKKVALFLHSSVNLSTRLCLHRKTARVPSQSKRQDLLIICRNISKYSPSFIVYEQFTTQYFSVYAFFHFSVMKHKSQAKFECSTSLYHCFHRHLSACGVGFQGQVVGKHRGNKTKQIAYDQV